MDKLYDITVHRGLMCDDNGDLLHTRIDVVQNVDDLDRAKAIAATYRRNGYVVMVYQALPYGYLTRMRDVPE